MLRPQYIEQLPENMIALYSQMEQDILADAARRLKAYEDWIPSADYQYRKMIALGNYHNDVMEELAARTGQTRQELEMLMQQAGAKSMQMDTEIYKAHGLSPPPLAASKALQAVMVAGLKRTSGIFKNLTKTTAQTATKQFENALDRAYMQITSGAFDYNTAIRMAIKDLAKQGVGAITYPTGRMDSLETAVRRAVVTGVNQTAVQMQLSFAEEMGCDLVETTAHAGARPSHTEWQGRVFSLSGSSAKYPEFEKSTGYGTGEGLAGWNCRHSFYPYFDGSPRAYTQEMLKQYDAKNYTYNGRSVTEYEVTQQQRYTERQIRRWKRENIAMNAAGLDTTESAAKIRQWKTIQRDFLKQTGLKRQIDRE